MLLTEQLTTIDIAVNLEPTYRQLETMHLDKSPFIIISVIGQELLAQAKYNAAVQVKNIVVIDVSELTSNLDQMQIFSGIYIYYIVSLSSDRSS